jgi:flagellar hook assembly protein FlgD
VTLDIVDPSGEPIGRSKSFDSDPITVISNNLKDDFYNYPNPFGRGGYTSTIFHFRLETESNVEIRIFTLLGELVRTFKREGITERIVDGDPYFRWDGKNDRGKTVLNGVYLCYIDIKPVNGGGSKRFLTKIAYIK